MHEAEQALVHRALLQDRQATQDLITRLTPLIQREAGLALYRRRAKGWDVPAETADLVQEVFVALWADDQRALRRWAPERGRSFENYFRCFASLQIASALRVRRADLLLLRALPVEEHETAAAADPEVRPLLDQVLQRLLPQLSEGERWLLGAFYLQDLSIDTIAARTGLRRGVLYQRKRRLLQSIRRIWRAQQGDRLRRAWAASPPA